MREKTCELLLQGLSSLYRVYPHISVKIELTWGTKAGHFYLKSLLLKDEDTRVGFREDIFQILMRMYILHVNEFGDFNDPLVLGTANIEDPNCMIAEQI